MFSGFLSKFEGCRGPTDSGGSLFMFDLRFDSPIPPKQTAITPQTLDSLRHLFVISEKRKKAKAKNKQHL